MSPLIRIAFGGLLATSVLSSAQANAGCHGGGRSSYYRAPVVVYRPVVVDPHHHHDHDDGPGIGGPGGGPGGGGPGFGPGGAQGPNGGQGQLGQNGQNQNQNGVTQNQNNSTAVQVPSGSQITLSGDFGTQGQVYLSINNVKLPLTVDEWTGATITLTLPAVQLAQAQSASIDVVIQGGRTDSIAITLNPKARLVVSTRPQTPAGQGASNNGNLASSEVAGAQ